MRKVLALLSMLLWAALARDALARDQVWFETPVAEVSIGLRSNGETVQRAFYLAFVGPIEAISNPQVARDCADDVVRPLRDSLRRSLEAARLNAEKADEKSPLGIRERTQRDLNATTSALLAITINVEGEFLDCIQKKGAPARLREGFYLSLVQRDCTLAYCPLSKTRRRLSDDEDAPVFTSVHGWLGVRSAVEQRNATNRHFRLKFTANNESVILKADFEPICEVNTWPGLEAVAGCERMRATPALGEDRVKVFKALVAQARANRAKSRPGGADKIEPRIPYAAALVVEVRRNDFVRIADIVDDPAAGFARAAEKGDLLDDVSNEAVRALVMECRHFRDATDDAALARCAGFPVEAAVLKACLGGAACLPKLPDTIKSAAILLNHPDTLRDLAKASALPRYLPGDVKAMKAIYDSCLQGKAADYACVSEKLLASDADLAQAKDCLKARDRGACALQAFGKTAPPEMRCISGTEDRQTAECLLKPMLPPKAQAAYECARKLTPAEQRTCFGAMVGGEAGRLAACRADTANNNSLLLATCVTGEAISPEVRAGLACVGSGQVTLVAVATCAATTQAPPHISAQIGCITQARGEPLAAGVCIAAANLDLSPNQQLAAQCLATTGGEPQSFAICFGGQLTMQEMVQCEGKNFGEGNCFGENNEFQKLARALTGSAIGPNSVVADIITVNMRPAQMAFTMCEPLVNKATSKIASVIDQVVEDAKAAARGDLGGLARTAVAAMTQPLVTLGRALGL